MRSKKVKKSALLIEYLDFLRDYQCSSEATIVIRRNFVKSFLTYIKDFGQPSKLFRLSAKMIHDYIIKTSRPMHRASKKHLTSSIRSFLKFAYIKGYLKSDLREAVPVIAVRKLDSLPQGIPWEDVQKLMLNGVIHVRQTKFFKSRLIPLSKSSTHALIKYKKERAKIGYSEEVGTPFFFNNIGKPCKRTTVPRAITTLMKKVGLKTVQGKTPRVHDIRHSFATRWLLDFYKSGKDPTAYLPVLATYLGHANIANTQVYLHPSIELLNIAAQKVQSYVNSL